MRYKLYGAGLLLALAAGVGWYFATRTDRPRDVPAVPTEWVDPAIVRFAADKRRAVEADPTSATAWGELGMTFHAHDRPAEAIPCYEAAAQLAPDHARWPYLHAKQLIARNKGDDADRAQELLQITLQKQFPSLAHQRAAELTLADQFLERGRSAEGAKIYQRVFATDPGNAQAAFFMAWAAWERGDLGTAIPIFLAQAKNPYSQKKAAAALAAVHRQKGESKEADGFEYASSLLPADRPWPNPFSDEVSKFRRGRQVMMDEVSGHEALGSYPQALAAAERLVDLYPTPETRVLFGRALVNAKNYDAAVAALDDALAADPKSVMAHASLGMSWFGKATALDGAGQRAEADGLYRKSIAAFGRALELKPDYAPGYLQQARAHARLGQYADAARAAQVCINLRPEEWEPYLVSGEVLAAQGKKPEAIRALEQAVKLASPQEPRPREALKRMNGS